MSSNFLSLNLDIDENAEINIHNSYLSLRIKFADLIQALTEIKRATKAKNLTSAIELMYFCSPTKESLAMLGLVITIQRCARDGNTIPKVSLFDLYQKIKCD